MSSKSALHAKAASINRGPLPDTRELVFSQVFVKVSLTDGKKKRAFDKAKLSQIITNACKKEAGYGHPVCATFLDNPLNRAEGTLIMRGKYDEEVSETQ